jgi:hypothetical protein
MRTAHKILAKKKLGTLRLGELHAKWDETINMILKEAWQKK